MRLNQKEFQTVKAKTLAHQMFRCALCQINLMEVPSKDVCLDHDHKTGAVRGVLCRNCNGAEGKVYNLANRCKRDSTPLWWITRLAAYLKFHAESPVTHVHPTFRTPDEKRLKRNALARKRRLTKDTE